MKELEIRREAWNEALIMVEGLITDTLLPTVNARWLREKVRAARMTKRIPNLGGTSHGWTDAKVRAQSLGAAKK